MKKLNVGVVGVGHLGSNHARIYSELKNVNLAGVCDINEELAKSTAKRYKTDYFTDYKNIFKQVDAVSIAAPTALHYKIAKDFMEAGIHVLIEKPITKTIEEVDTLLEIQKNKNLIIQVGHIERFNPAISAVANIVNEPRFIECQRLSKYLKRAVEVGVVLDLMIHDIDIILELVNSDVESIEAIGANILSKT
ncbi:MAG: Gfo/Idh/MocA family oxidoreductase, partial [Candidatus Omnitrophota bacterium]|nr:Gfo/Idh/MocA family oxidoreductase [Candidatus Omnitrophota bacterium]